MKRLELGVGVTLVALVAAMAVVSFVWTPYDPIRIVPADRLLRPGPAHLLGTDAFGRDLFSRLLVGARSCLSVGVISVGIAALIGVPVGLFVAQGPRWLARVVLRATDIAQALPALLLAILLAGVFGGSTTTAMVAIGAAAVPQFIRVTRAGARQVLSSDYVAAARSAGIPRWRTAWTHVLPNIGALIGVQASVTFAMAILAEAALSYLGLATQPPTPTWGRMLKEAQDFLYLQPGQVLWPALAVAGGVLGFNLLGDGLRDRLDPRLREAA
ncbi:ABC transporter permease [Nigerium massiliense]|uniref:ABC transporter permease n=1 Tax=Nigerium massiliense TaxID=1522317 RepID=UPI00058FAD75|nr:ABC transporter permease [Nigerium massiliense]